MSDEDKSSGKLLSSALFGLIVVGGLVFFWPSLIPFGFFEFWTIKGSVWEAAKNAWPIYLFGLGMNFRNLFRENDYVPDPHEILFGGFGISLWAGIVEELCFRWLIFISAIVILPVTDWLLFQLTGIHVVQWIYGFLCPIANFFTLGYLEPYLLNGYGWAVGAAIISANGRFRNGHAYQGPVGFTVSWFLGMYFFWVLFTYGLIAAMTIHFLYNFFIFTLVFVDAVIEKRNGI